MNLVSSCKYLACTWQISNGACTLVFHWASLLVNVLGDETQPLTLTPCRVTQMHGKSHSVLGNRQRRTSVESSWLILQPLPGGLPWCLGTGLRRSLTGKLCKLIQVLCTNNRSSYANCERGTSRASVNTGRNNSISKRQSMRTGPSTSGGHGSRCGSCCAS